MNTERTKIRIQLPPRRKNCILHTQIRKYKGSMINKNKYCRQSTHTIYEFICMWNFCTFYFRLKQC
ncbi:hypothetical protein EMIT0196P_80262 [Pseudomonas chlororaphis]